MQEGHPNEPPQETGIWQFHADEGAPAPQAAPTAPATIEWTASEYIAHEKSAGWYLLLGLAAVAGTTLVYLLTRDRISAAVIFVVAIVFGVFAARKPHVLSYRLDQSGLHIGDKLYKYDQFKSFSVQEEGAVDALFFMPLKRFMPGISIYFPPDQGEQIVTVLGSYLPHEERQPDAVDRFMRRVRF